MLSVANSVPTIKLPFTEADIFNDVGLGCSSLVRDSKSPTRNSVSFLSDLGSDFNNITLNGTQARLSYRAWSEEWRLRCIADTSNNSMPPLNSGDRYTSSLSLRGKIAISESCDYVSKKLGGFKTFLTLTVDQNARDQINNRIITAVEPRFATSEYIYSYSNLIRGPDDYRYCKTDEIPLLNDADGYYCSVVYAKNPQSVPDFIGPVCSFEYSWESSLQKKISNFVDAMTKVFKRGFVPKYLRGSVRKTVDGNDFVPITFSKRSDFVSVHADDIDDFLFLWVAESPKNSSGDDNLHVHMLTNFRCEYSAFPCFAKRIESLWGLGFAHLEKLRSSDSAASYIAKAANYLSKSSDNNNQGKIRGNRYAICAKARAPDWSHVSTWQWGILGSIIKLSRDDFSSNNAVLLNNYKKVKNKIFELQGDGVKNRSFLKRLKFSLQKKISNLGAKFGRYNVIFKSPIKLRQFLMYAVSLGWSPVKKPDGCWLYEFKKQLRERQSRALFNHSISSCLNSWLSLVKNNSSGYLCDSPIYDYNDSYSVYCSIAA